MLALWPAASEAAPQRVVSVNLCTDQLAMLLAAPGQLVSVSWLAADPRSSVMPEAARGYQLNRGGAEEVFALRPDLVLASSWTRRETVSLLRRLGVEVVELAPAQRLEEIAPAIRELAALLGRTSEGEVMANAFTRNLAALRGPETGRSAAVWEAGGYTSGSGTLSDEVLRAAGLRNLAARAGIAGGGYLPLERLVMERPDLILSSAPWPGASRAEDLLVHPALAALRRDTAGFKMRDADWVCGLPQILHAIGDLKEAMPQ
ncbi:ABC transporter substrate-binding protein [Falsigemmobacter faecalis]|uniref:ABC transporter substrate-binding protein n=1 Tax=Falsigemmobacter faecalis TaxID=2488730 RepID=A0A3P3DE98_9RHOB|nr:ABC transporter substrate-binding protein [Falsigemmobacter faecalis]